MSGHLARLLAFVSTRRAAVLLFAVALVVFWFQALGWPMAKGRDTWDYLVYYLQLFDSDPPLSQVQLFRAPLTPLVVGLPMDLGGSVLLEVVRTRARYTILDLTGIEAMDTATAGHLLKLSQAMRLLGADAIITGIHPVIAQTIVGLGMDLTSIVTRSTLREGLQHCIQRMSVEAL